MSKKSSRAEQAARGTKKDPNAREQTKKRVGKQLKRDGRGILVYVVASVAIFAFLYFLSYLGII